MRPPILRDVDPIELRAARNVLLSALLVLGVFLWPFEGEVPNRYADLTRALVEERTLVIDRYHENTSDKAFRAGHYYSVAAPGPSFIGAPAYGVVRLLGGSPFAGQAAMTLVVGPLAGACAAAGLFVAAGLVCPSAPLGWRLLLVTAYALGTFAFPLATVLYPHALVAALITWSAAAALAHAATASPRAAAAAGACAGALPACDYPTALLVPAFAAWVALGPSIAGRARARALLAFAAGAAPPLLALGLYHTACFGAPWRTGYQFFAFEGLRDIIATGVSGFVLPTGHTLLETSVGTSRGLFWFAPPALVGVAAALATARRRPGLAALALGGGVAYWLLNAARLLDWYGGYTWGPRYQAAGLPLLLLPLAGAADLRWARPALIAATVAGVCVNLVGAGGRWPQTLAAGLTEVSFFGVQAKAFGLLLGAGRGYHPAGVERLTPAIVVLTTTALLLAAAALLALWRPGRRATRAAASVALAFACLQVVAVSRSWRREEALRQHLRDREFISFVWHFRTPENFVVASDLARAMGRDDEAATLAERALALAPGDEAAALRLGLARRDRAALQRLAAAARDPAVRRAADEALRRP